MDMKLAAKAHKLAKAGKSGPEIAKEIGVTYAADAHRFAAVGGRMAQIERFRLTEPERLLIICLAADERANLARGTTSSSKSPDVSHRARKGSGWANATASKRLGERRPNDHPRGAGTGLRLVWIAGNGHMSLTAAGWAMIHAIEASAAQ
jgi:hypothetical protein